MKRVILILSNMFKNKSFIVKYSKWEVKHLSTIKQTSIRAYISSGERTCSIINIKFEALVNSFILKILIKS